MIFENSEVEEKEMKFPVWMTVEIGGVSKKELVALEEGFVVVSNWARDVIKQDAFTVSPIKRTLRLACCEVRDLGFTEDPTFAQLQECLSAFSGELCPAEVGPHLRRQLKDQKKGVMFWLIMKQIADSDGSPSVFRLCRGDGGFGVLDGIYAHSASKWHLGRVVVFVLPDEPSNP